VGTLQLVSTNGAYINIQSVDFGDANNNLAEYNESGMFSVQYQNVGTLSSGALVSSISSTSGYVTITDATQSLASIAAGASYTATNAFAFTLGNAIPDQTVIPFSFDTTSGTESWQGSYNLTVNAPALALGSVTISEVSGNGNGRLDPGETADLMISVYNTGHAVSPAGSLTLSCPSSGITIQQTSAAVLALSAGSSVSTSFRIQTAAGMAVGTIAAFTFNVMAGNYTATRNENINIGLLIEDFESGGFGSFDWQLSGNVNWGTVNSGAYAGSYCAKSGIITHSQSSNLQLSLSLPASGNISFYYKVSSEGSYDFLTFYIDGVQQGSWSGEIGWTQISYPVTAGTHIFKWTYAKDSIVSSGSDCAWLDNVIFPSGATAPLYPPQNLTASAGNGLVSLSWQAPLSVSPTGYQVFRNDVNITTTPVTGLSYTDATVTNEQTYTYYLKAVYAGGISPAGNSVTAMPTAAQSVLVAIGTGTSSQSYPIDRYYNYSTHEAIYLASELGSAGNLTKIAYYKSSGTDLNSISAVSIYLKHTTATTLTSGTYALTDYTQVYSGSFPNTSASGWMEVSFNTPFAYNGSSHLSVLIVKGYQAYISTYPSWRYTASTTRSRMARSDSAQPSSLTASAYLPNVRFTKLVNTTPQPVISVTPAQLSYSQYQAQITNQTVTLSNTGTANLSWQLSARESRPAGWLSVNPASGNIAAGANQTLNVTVNTAGMTSGSYSTAVTLSSNASNAALLNIPVSLTVIAAPTSPRMVAEYEPMQGALIRYPLGIPYSIVRELAESSKVYTIVADAATRTTALSNYQANGVNTANCEFIIASTESYWTRDYGPWYVYDADNQLKIVDFTYNRPRPGDDAVPIAVGTYLGQTVYPLSVSHTGGNIMTDGYGVAASTNLVLSENSTQTQQQINTQMSAYLGIDDYRLYEDPNNTYIDHIDCWGKYLDADKVLIRSVPVAHPQYAQIEAVAAQFAAGTSSYGTPYRVFRVYTPNDEPYTNSFIFNNKILVPQMATANDAAALAVYRSAMPGYEVLGYTAGANAWASTDAIHCRINAIPEPDQVHITHSAIQNPVTHQSYTIIADIDCNNPLIADSVYVMWKTHWQQNWRKVRLNFDGTIWSKTMPMLQYGDSLYYYLHAVDNTGKAANLPLCAGLDPFRMAVSSQTELDIAVSLDTVSGMLNIIWSPVPWANSYRIYGSSSADGEYQLIGTATTNSWHHLISDADSSRYFRVTASTDIVWGD
jgi:agmatine/peptidylarginine deiminase